jgi:hypothetical protein
MEAALTKPLGAVAGLLAVVSVLGGCTRPLIPIALQTGRESNSAPDHPVTSAQSGVRVGVDIYVKVNFTTAQVRAWGTRDIRYIVRDLGVRNISLTWNLFSPFHHSNQVRQVGQTTQTGSAATGRAQYGSSLTPAKLAILTAIAEKYHASVEYRPLVKVQGPYQWSGYIAPYSITSWFNDYFAAELPYLRLAQRYHVAEVVVGTELADLEKVAPKAQWEAFLHKVSSVYRGQLSYTTWEGHYWYAAGRALPPIRSYGLAAYPDFTIPGVQCPRNPTVAQLVSKWMQQFSTVPSWLRTHTTIDELGIPAGCGAFRRPWNWNITYSPDQIVQARWFTSACIAVARLGLRGIYFWNLNLADNPYQPGRSLTSFAGKVGAGAIRRCGATIARYAKAKPVQAAHGTRVRGIRLR